MRVIKRVISKIEVKIKCLYLKNTGFTLFTLPLPHFSLVYTKNFYLNRGYDMMNTEKLPIILAHGIARFDILGSELKKTINKIPGINFTSDCYDYFKGIQSHLKKYGFDVYSPSVDFAAKADKRAENLRDQINALLKTSKYDKVHIIAHSMGGLDARHMIVDKNMEDKVDSLTTIGTPHLGTSFADWGVEYFGDTLLKTLNHIIDLGGIEDLTTESCKLFNNQAEKSEAANSVKYQVYYSYQDRDFVFDLLQKPWDIINKNEGDNDGLVPVTSQKWTEILVGIEDITKTVKQIEFPVSADHLNEVGWWDPNELNQADSGDLFAWFKNKEQYEASVRDAYLQIASKL